MSFDLQKSIVRILKENGETAGTGFLLNNEGLIATCAHVIWNENEQRPRPERVTLIFHATGEKRQAFVAAEWWRSAQAEDVAILRLDGLLPQGVEVSLLGSTPGVSERPFDTFGFPRSNPKDGIWGKGEIMRATRLQEIDVLQLSSREVTPGFSGAPVVDRQNHRVVGLVTAITPTDQFGRLAETAFATPVETLRAICPALQLSDVRPFRSLEAFTEEEAAFFFGRQSVIDNLLASLHKETRLLPVLGPSGSGKSSVVRAGLIPHLRQGGRGTPRGSDRWEIIVTRPLNDPLRQLAIAMQGQVGEQKNLSKDIRAWFHRFSDKKHLLLIFDQFEELYVTCAEEVRQDFLQQLSELLNESLPVTVLLIMRDDFYSRLAQHEALGRMLSQGLINVPPTLKHGELDEIVRKPAASAGILFESDDLVELIIKDATSSERNEVSDGEGEADSTLLPLLEFTLNQLWEARQDGILTFRAYQDIGGVTGALTQWANQTYDGLKDKEQQRLAHRIFTDLVHLGNHSQKLPDSRQRRRLSALWRKSSEEEAVRQVVGQLVDARLLVTGRDSVSNEETIEIIHDALLREWALLRGWLEEDQRFLLWHQKFQDRMADWLETNPVDPEQREKDKLLQGSDLVEATGKWMKDRASDLSQKEQDFIVASRQYKEQREQDWQKLYEDAEEQRQIVLAQNLAAQAELLYSQRAELLELGVLLAVESVRRFPCPETDRALRVGCMLMRRCLMTFTCPEIAALFFSANGPQLYIVARNGELATLEKPGGGLVFAPFKPHPLLFDAVLSADGHLLATASGNGGRGIEDPVSGRVFLFNDEHERDVKENIEQARTQSLLADIFALDADSERGNAEIWDLATHQRLASFEHQNWVTAVTFSPDGKVLATASEDGTAGLWEVVSGKQIALLSHQKSVYAVAFSPDGKLLATASEDGTAGLWEITSGQQVASLPHQKSVYALAFSPDGQMLATASADGTATLWKVAGGGEIASLPHRHTVNDLVFSSDGQLLATASGDATAALWDATSGRLLVSLPHQKSVHAVAFSPNGEFLATASCDQTAALWDVVTGRRLALFVHPGGVKKLLFSPNSQQLITVSASEQAFTNVLTVWDIAGGRSVAPLVHQGEVTRVTFSDDGQLLITAYAEGMMGVWEVATGAPITFSPNADGFIGTMFASADVRVALQSKQSAPIEGHEGEPLILWSPHRRLQAVIDTNDPTIVELRHAIKDRLVASFVHQNEVKRRLFSRDERFLATVVGKAGTSETVVTVWDIEAQRRLVSLTHQGQVNQVVFSSRGDLLAIASESGQALVWEVSTGHCIATLIHEKAVLNVVFSPDGRFLATASEEGVAKIWEVATGQSPVSMVHLRSVTHVLFSPDGQFLATASRDGMARIWEVATGRNLVSFPHLRSITEVVFSPDGHFLATASEDWTAQIWPWRSEDLIREAQSRLTRNLTFREWQQYFRNEPYHKTCPDLP